jgi:hypothetical protein
MIAETWFHQNGQIKFQQTTYWMTGNTHASHSQEICDVTCWIFWSRLVKKHFGGWLCLLYVEHLYLGWI